MNQSTVNQRLNLLVDHFENGVKAAFARKAGISPQGAQELLAGRKGDPSFKVLVKILESYPTVNANWLVLGRGAMLHTEDVVAPTEAAKVPEQEYATIEQYEELSSNVEHTKRLIESYAENIKEARLLEQVYRLVGTPPYDKMLADRLSITQDEARDLVLSGRIRSTYAGKDNDRARRNGISYLVSEAAVREFLGDLPQLKK